MLSILLILLIPFLYSLYPEANSHHFSFLSCFLKQILSVEVLTLPTSHSQFGLGHLNHSFLCFLFFLSQLPLLRNPICLHLLTFQILGFSPYLLVQLCSHNHFCQAWRIWDISHYFCAFPEPLFYLPKPNFMHCCVLLISLESGILYNSVVILTHP